MKKHIETFLKLSISALILFLILRQMDMQNLLRYMFNINLATFFVGVFFIFLGYVFSAVRWIIFLKAYHLNIGFIRALKIVLISLTAGMVLPSGAGPDIVRFYYAQKSNMDKRAEVLSSIFMDRFVGVITLSVLAFVGLKIGIEAFRSVSNVITIVLIILFAILGFFLSGGFSLILLKLLGNIRKFRIGERIRKFTQAFSLYERNRKILLLAMMVSVLMQVLFGTGNFFVALSLGIEAELYKIIFITLTVNFVTMLPISFSGIGVREGAFVFLMGELVGKEAAFAVSVFYYLASVLAFSPGLVFIMTEPLKDEGMGDS